MGKSGIRTVRNRNRSECRQRSVSLKVMQLYSCICAAIYPNMKSVLMATISVSSSSLIPLVPVVLDLQALLSRWRPGGLECLSIRFFLEERRFQRDTFYCVVMSGDRTASFSWSMPLIPDEHDSQMAFIVYCPTDRLNDALNRMIED